MRIRARLAGHASVAGRFHRSSPRRARARGGRAAGDAAGGGMARHGAGGTRDRRCALPARHMGPRRPHAVRPRVAILQGSIARTAQPSNSFADFLGRGALFSSDSEELCRSLRPRDRTHRSRVASAFCRGPCGGSDKAGPSARRSARRRRGADFRGCGLLCRPRRFLLADSAKRCAKSRRHARCVAGDERLRRASCAARIDPGRWNVDDREIGPADDRRPRWPLAPVRSDIAANRMMP